jgi:hypothetical protein
MSGCAGAIVGAAVVIAIIYAGANSGSVLGFLGSLVLAGVVVGMALKGN